MTRERRSVGQIGAAVLPGEDALNFENQRRTRLWLDAIPAGIIHTAADELAKGDAPQPACD